MCCDGEAADIWQEEERTARKEHQCVECFKPIPPRSRYVYISSLFEGRWLHDKMCLPCRQAWTEHLDHMRNVHREHCMVFVGGFHECAGEHTAEECAAILAYEEREKSRTRSYVMGSNREV